MPLVMDGPTGWIDEPGHDPTYFWSEVPGWRDTAGTAGADAAVPPSTTS